MSVRHSLRLLPALILLLGPLCACHRYFADRALENGCANLDAGRYAEAVTNFTEVLRLDPQSMLAYYNRALARNATHQYELAIDDFNHALKLDPKYAPALHYRGSARFQVKQYRQSLEDFSSAVAIEPGNAEYWRSRGLARQMAGETTEALKDLDQALLLNPSLSDALNDRGWVKGILGDLPGALQDYDKAAALAPLQGTFSNRSGIKQRMGDLDGALADSEMAVSLDSSSVDALCNRGYIKSLKGEMRGAMTDFDWALKLDPDHNRSREGRGVLKYKMGRWKEALADLYRISESAEPGMHEYMQLMIWLLHAKLGDTKNADLDLAEYAARRWKTEPDAWPAKIATFLLGSIKEVDFLVAAGAGDDKKIQGQRCEAFFYTGMKRVLTGDKAAAADFFQKCLATGQRDYLEYDLAQSELKALGK